MKKNNKKALPVDASTNTEKSINPFCSVDKSLKAFLAIFIFGLVVRILYLFESSGNPTFLSPIIDSNYYDRSAHDLVLKGLLSGQLFFQSFLYPLFLAGVYALTGSSIFWAKIFQAFL
jgi:hypothetical protein